MEAQDWFLIILTFVTGLFIGAFVYLTSFVPTYLSNSFGGDESDASSFSIIGKTYGGYTTPNYIHPAFRLLGNGEYMYVPGGTDSDALEPVEGKLPKSLINEIKVQATKSKLSSYERNSTLNSCRSYADGFDFEYRVVVDGEEFQLDSCKTALGYDTALAELLDEVWNYLNDGESSRSSFWNSSGSLDEKATKWLQSYFDPEYQEEDDELTACTMDAKQCPDGSYVGRSGPNCEFAACPGE